jgi:ATP-dependent Zn protease
MDGHQSSDIEKLATAYHEAGHAVVALAVGRNIEKLSVVRNSLRLGVVQLGKGRTGRKQDYYENESVILLGGLVSEQKFTGVYNWSGAQQDLSSLRRLSLARVSSDKEAERLERKLLEKTSYLLDQEANWRSVEKIVIALMEGDAISGRAARHLFEQEHHPR